MRFYTGQHRHYCGIDLGRGDRTSPRSSRNTRASVSLDTCWVQCPEPAPRTEAKTKCEVELGRLPEIPPRPHRAAAQDSSTHLTEEDSYVLGSSLA